MSTKTETIEKDPSSAPTYILQPTRGWVKLNFKEMWNYRELLYFITWKEVKVRYQQTVMGVAWPLCNRLFR